MLLLGAIARAQGPPARTLAAASTAATFAQRQAASTADPHATATPAVTAVRVSQPPRLDGHLDDEAWRIAAAVSDFLQRDPDEGQPATERTELRLVYDDSAIYVGVRLFDREAQRIVRRLARRDTVADADRFTIFLDPRHDHLTGVQFQVSAAGTLVDAAIYNDSWSDSSWDAVWDAAVSIDEAGWTVEMRIPLSQLRFSIDEGSDRTTWGLNASRYIQRKNETAWLVLVPKNESGLASRMGHLTGLEGLRRPRTLELVPYSVARTEFIQPPAPGDPFNDGSRAFGGVGVDLKYGLGRGLTLDATVNPDFGQVEVDPAVVNLTAFETYFEERRPFFIEGAQIFGNFGQGGANSFWGFDNSEPTLFYSRRIGRTPQGSASAPSVDRPSATTILGAAKLTGKTAHGWSIGVLEALTGREYARLWGDGRHTRAEVEPLTNYFVGRVQREGARGGFGALTTSVARNLRSPALTGQLARQALVVGGDGYRFLDAKREWVVTGMLAVSRVDGTAPAIERLQRAPQRYYQRPDAYRLDPTATSLSGWAGRITLNRNSGLWQVNAALWGVSPGFESNDLGFTWNAGIGGAHALVLWRKPTPDRFTRGRSVWVAKWWTWDAAGRVQGDGWFGNLFLQFPNYWTCSTSAGFRRRAVDSWLTRGGPTMTSPGGGNVNAFASTDARRALSLSGGTTYSWNEFGGWGVFSNVSVAIKPAPSLNISLGPTLSRSHSLAQYVRTVSDPTASETFGARYIFADLDQTQLSMTTRVTWVLAPRASLEVYAQPLLATGDYWGLKELARPATFEFLRYGEQGSTLAFDLDAGRFDVDPDGPGPAPAFGLANPDFNFKSLRVNAVFRWEWRLGSTLYLVWTQQRQDFAHPGTFSLGRDARALFGAPADDVLLIKVAYWWGR